METTEKVVEAYVRYVRGWATIPNIRCGDQKEIDLFAVDPLSNERYHIETSVSVSSFSKLNADEFTPGEHKIRTRGAAARRKLGFYIEHKFGPAPIQQKLTALGCDCQNVRRVIVTWDAKDGTIEKAAEAGIEVWFFPELMREIVNKLGKNKSYFGDDTLRTLLLFVQGGAVKKAVTN